MKKCEKLWKSVQNSEMILPFSCRPLVFLWLMTCPKNFFNVSGTFLTYGVFGWHGKPQPWRVHVHFRSRFREFLSGEAQSTRLLLGSLAWLPLQSLAVKQKLFLCKLGNGRNTVSRVLFRRRELTEFCGKLGEFCEKLGEFAFAHK